MLKEIIDRSPTGTTAKQTKMLDWAVLIVGATLMSVALIGAAMAEDTRTEIQVDAAATL